jgi:UDP-glucose 4-epimerase
VTKLAAEQLCLLYWRNYGVPVVCTRYFTVYGPRQRPDMAFQRFIHAIVNEQDIYIYGDGEQTRDFTFVRDAVEGTIRAAFSDVQGEVFNIGGGSRVTLNQVIDLLGDLLNRRVRRRYLAAQRGDARNTAAQIQHAARLLGYAPSIHLEDGLKYQIEWAGAVLLHPLPV